MKITFRNDMRIIAEHECMTFMFSIDALSGERAIQKTANTHYNTGRKVVGMYLDFHYRAKEVLWNDEYHRLIAEISDIKMACKHTHTTYNDRTRVTGCPGCGAMKLFGKDWLLPSELPTIEITKQRHKELQDNEDLLTGLLKALRKE